MSNKSKASVTVKEESSSSFRSQTKSAKVVTSSSDGQHTSMSAHEKRTSSKSQRSVQSFEDFVFRPMITPGSPIGIGANFEDVSKQLCHVNDGETFEMKLDVQEYKPDEVQVKITDNLVTITGKQEQRKDEKNFQSKEFSKKFTIPSGVKVENISCTLTTQGVLKITAPIEPQGRPGLTHRQIQEIRQESANSSRKSSISSDISSVSRDTTTISSRHLDEEVLVHPNVKPIARKTDSASDEVSRELSTTNDGKNFETKLEIKNFKSEEINIRITKTLIKIEGKHEDKFSSRSFYKEFTIPHGVRANTIQCNLDDELGILTIRAPIQQTQPALDESRLTQTQQQEALSTTTQQHQQVTSSHKTVKKQLQHMERTDSASSTTSSIQDSRQVDDVVVRPIIDRSISQDMILNFEDVSKQISRAQDGKNFEVKLEVAEYQPDELVVKITDNWISIEGKHEIKEENKFSSRQFSKKFTIPSGVKPENITSTLSNKGVLTISAPIEPTDNLEAIRESTRDIANTTNTQQATLQQQSHHQQSVTSSKVVQQQHEQVVQEQQQQQRVQQQHVVEQQNHVVDQQQQQTVTEQKHQEKQVEEQQRQESVVQQQQQTNVQQQQQTTVQQQQQTVVQQERERVQEQEVIQEQQHKLTALNVAKHQEHLRQLDTEECLIQPIIEPESPSVKDVRFEDITPQLCCPIDGKKFEVSFDIPEYKPTEIEIKISEGFVTIEGKQETANSSRSFFKKFSIPQGVKPEEIRNSLSPKGVLTISAPISSAQPCLVDQPQETTNVTKTKEQSVTVDQQLQQSVQQQQQSVQQQKITESDSVSSMTSNTSTINEAIRKVGENYLLRPTMSTISISEDSRFEDVTKEVKQVDEGKTFETKLNVPEYKPEELKVTITENMVTIEGKQETTNSSRSFFKKFTIPQGVKPEDITSSLTPNGVLTISAPITSTGHAFLPNPEQKGQTSPTQTEEPVATANPIEKSKQESVNQQISQSDSLNSITSITSTVNEAISKVGENYRIRPTMSTIDVTEDSRFEDVSTTVARVDEGKKFETILNVPEYKPEELKVSIAQNMVTIEGKQETATSSRSFFKKFTIPQGVKPEDITSSLNPQGVLIISAPIQPTVSQPSKQQTRTTETTQEVNMSQTKQQEQLVQQKVRESDSRSSVNSSTSTTSVKESVRKVGDNYVLRPRIGIDKLIDQDTRFEDVTKQVACLDEGRTFETKFDVPEYKPEEISIRVSDNMVIIEGKQETTTSSRSFYKKFTVPQGVKPEDITSSLNPQGVLTISAPIQSSPGNQLQEQVNTLNSQTNKTEQTINQTAVTQEEQSVHQQQSVHQERSVHQQQSVHKQESVHQQQSVHHQSSLSDNHATRSVLDSQRRIDEDFIIRPIRGIIDTLLEKDSKFEDVSKQLKRLESEHEFEMKFDVPEYKPEELQVKISDTMVTIEGKQETANSSRSFFKKFSIPQGVKPETITSSLSSKGVLTISARIESTSRQTSTSQTQQSLTSSSNVSSDRQRREVFLQPKFNLDAILSGIAQYDDVSKEISHTLDGKTFEVNLDVQDYKPEEIEVRISNNLVTIEGKQEIRVETSFKSRSFSKKFSIPQGVKPENIKCILNADGRLRLSAPVETSNLSLSESISGTTSVSQQHKQQQSSVKATSTSKKVSSSVSSTRTSSNF